MIVGDSPAEKLLKRFGVERPDQIDLEAIAYELGALVVYEGLNGCDARIVGHSKQAIITVNSYSSPERQRFSLGHEIGHWVDGWRGRGFLCGKTDIGEASAIADAKRDTETQANRFASDLLLPDYLFAPACSQKPLTIDTAQELARVFRASITATVIKLVKRSSYPGVAVCYSRGKREWFISGNGLPEGFFPHFELNPDTAAFELLYTDQWGKTPVAMSKASAWISRRDASDLRVRVQSIKVAKDRVVAVIGLMK